MVKDQSIFVVIAHSSCHIKKKTGAVPHCYTTLEHWGQVLGSWEPRGEVHVMHTHTHAYTHVHTSITFIFAAHSGYSIGHGPPHCTLWSLKGGLATSDNTWLKFSSSLVVDCCTKSLWNWFGTSSSTGLLSPASWRCTDLMTSDCSLLFHCGSLISTAPPSNCPSLLVTVHGSQNKDHYATWCNFQKIHWIEYMYACSTAYNSHSKLLGCFCRFYACVVFIYWVLCSTRALCDWIELFVLLMYSFVKVELTVRSTVEHLREVKERYFREYAWSCWEQSCSSTPLHCTKV